MLSFFLSFACTHLFVYERVGIYLRFVVFVVGVYDIR